MAVLLHQSYRRRTCGYAKLEKAFQFQHEQLRFAYPENFLTGFKETKFDNYLPRGIAVIIPYNDESMMQLILPTPVVSNEEDKLDSHPRPSVAVYNYLGNHISLGENSPLVTLAKMHDVALPKKMMGMSLRHFTKFFVQLQNAIYEPCGLNLYFHKDWGNNYNLTRAQARKENGYTEFFMAALFAAEHGGRLSFPKYVKLFSKHLDLVAKTNGKTVALIVDQEERNHALTILTHPELLNDDAAFEAAVNTPLSLLKEIYAA
jgi:hypothetical protein